MTPLWQTREGLMPFRPEPRAVPHLWRWAKLYPLAARSAELVPVGRGGERRAIGLGNPGLPGDPYATPTLWAAIQYLAPRENAPEHRHTQSAFRFVLEGEGVWTVVDGDPVAMRRGDLLLTPGWHFHGHQNVSGAPMAWLDGLDIPLVATTDQGFFEFGPDELQDHLDPGPQPRRTAVGRSWPGTCVAPPGPHPASPLMAYRWAHTDEALRAQLELESEGQLMRLATIRLPGGTRAVRIDGGQAVETGHSDVGKLLAAPGWAESAAAAGGAQGRTVPATEIPWMRAKEVCIHAVDLGAGVTFGDLPPDFVAALLADVVRKRAGAGEGPELAAWLTGRAPDAPKLAAWL